MPANTPHTNLTDEELLTAYRSSRDNHWLGVLLQRYTALLLGVALKYLKDRAMAEDAVQHVFETTLTHLPVEPVLNFKGWLYILMRNHCLQLLRNKPYMADDSVIATMPATLADEDGRQWQEHTLEQMNEAILELNEEQRTTITLFYLQKCSYEQITDRTGYTFMQVKSYIQNGKRNLKTIITQKLRATRQ